MKHNFQDNAKLLQALRSKSSQRTAAVRWICRKNGWAPAVINLVKQLGGNKADGEDAFQEAIVTLMKNIEAGKYEGGSSLKTYFLAIGKNIYLKRRSKEKLKLVPSVPEQSEEAEYNLAMAKENSAERIHNLLEQAMANLGKKCREVLLLKQLNWPMEEIAERLGYSQAAVARNKADRCRKKLRKHLEENPSLHQKYYRYHEKF